MKTLLLLPLVAGVAYAYRPSDFIHEAHMTETQFTEMQEKLNHLNDIQNQILGLPQPKHRPGSGKINFDQEVESKPEQLPSLFEGDIILTNEQMNKMIENAEDQLWAQSPSSHKRTRRALTSYQSLRWSNTTAIPFWIDTQTGVSSQAVLAGLNFWQSNTCLSFKQSPTPFAGSGFRFFLGSGCYSYLGKVANSPQDISIGNGCTGLGTVSHEIGHALGFFHEQARYDRDNYIQVLAQNMPASALRQFSKQDKSAMEDYGTGYDYGSVMHYSSTGFSINGGNTITTLDQNYQTTIGQRNGPSFTDIKEVNSAYCDKVCPTKLACQNGGYTDVKDCSKCRCPDGFGGTLCERAADSPNACGNGDLTANNTFQTIRAQGNIQCAYVITAPPGHKVYFEVIVSTITKPFYRDSCTENFYEIKYKSDLSRTGARYCSFYPTISLSESEKLVVIFAGQYARSYPAPSFALKFRQDPLGAETTVAPTTKTTTSAPTTKTTTIPVTTPSTTTPKYGTHYPQTTTSTPGCSDWSPCTAKCGGCGTTSRRCGTTVQTQYCNTNPCGGSHCCLPFFYNKAGTCVRPYGDKEAIEPALKKYTEEELEEARNLRGGNGWYQETDN